MSRFPIVKKDAERKSALVVGELPSEGALVRSAHNVADLTRKLVQRFESNAPQQVEPEDLRGYIDRALALGTLGAQCDKSNELNELGTRLWNLSTRLKRDASTTVDPLIVILVRCFSFFVIDAAHRSAPKHAKRTEATAIRNLRISMKTARSCLEHGELDLASKVFQSAADYIPSGDRGRSAEHAGNPEYTVTEELTAEFWLQRTALAWKQGQLDAAEFMYSKVHIRYDDGDHIRLVEQQADLTYEIGKSFLRKEEYESATHWLERSCDTLDSQPRERLGPDSSELHLSAMHDLARSLLGLGNATSIERASDLIALMESEFGNKLAIALLKLKLLLSKNPVPAEEYQRVVINIVNSIVLTESTFKTIMCQIQKLKNLNTSLACKTLDIFFSVRLYEAANMSWYETGLVTRIWLSSPDSTDLEQASLISAIQDEIHQSKNTVFGPEAAHAAQTLLWKHIESANTAGQSEVAEAWCRIALHPLFDQGGHLNKSKLARKMILTALAKGDHAAAREAYFSMPNEGKSAAITKYLMYKVAIRSDDQELATESLSGIVTASDRDAAFLYACILEAQQFGSRKQAVMVMQQVLKKYNYRAPPDVYLPALLRCTSRLLMAELETGASDREAIVVEICKIFEAAAAQANCFTKPTAEELCDDKSRHELQWFAKNSYNLALKYCIDIHPELTIRLLDTCIHFLGFLGKENPQASIADLVHRTALCHFLAASALVVLARSEDNTEKSLQYYLEVRKHVEAFRGTFKVELDAVGKHGNMQASLTGKQVELLKYDLEAVVKLERWDDLDDLLAVR